MLHATIFGSSRSVLCAGLLAASAACSSDEDGGRAEASGGSGPGDAGASSATGGTSSTDTGGASSGDGGASSATGGTSSGDAGASAATGGTSSATGGTSAATGGTSSATFSTGLPGTAVLQDLDAQEVEQLCDALAAYLEAGAMDVMAEGMCRIMAVGLAGVGIQDGQATDAEVQAVCSEVYDPCVAEEPTSESDECSLPEGECTATVAEFEACINDDIALVESLLEVVPPCHELTVAKLQELEGMEDPGQSESCQVLEQKCPGAMAEQSGAADAGG